MHKLAASVTVLALAALSLAGCAASGSASCTPPSEADESTRALVSATGDVGTAPDVEVFTPIRIDEAVSWQTVEGEGTPLTATNQLLGADIELINGTSGETIYQSEYGDTPSTTTTGASLESALPGVSDLLECAQAGSRVVFALPAADFSEDALANFGLEKTDTLIGVFDVRSVYLDRADGADQFNSGTGLPSVVRAPDGRTGVVVPDSAAPTSTVVQLIKKGDGEKIAADSLAVVQYTAVGWNDRSLVKSTWDTASPEAVQPSAETQPFAASLEGQTVGSQVMVIVPAAAAEDGTTDADATVYVVDILGIAPPAAAQ